MPLLLAPAAQRPAISGSPSTCRVHERQTCALPTACQPAAAFGSAESSWPGTIRDLSPGGLRLTLGRRFEPGTGLAVELADQDNDETRTVLVKVVHVKRQDDGLWALGCKFISELSDDEVQQLVPAAPTAADKKTVADVHFQLGHGSATLVACVFRAMKVPASWPLTPGKVATISGGHASGSPWTVKLRVSRCEHRAEGWVFQGRLLHVPSAASWLRFLGQEPAMNNG